MARAIKNKKGHPTKEALIWVSNRQRKFLVDRDRTKIVAHFVLDTMGAEGAELSIVFVSDRRITQLNRNYLSRNRPTDVLSFSQTEGEGGQVNPLILGDVVISTETAAAQAEERGNPFHEELDILLVHGILHLLGYEHTLAEDEAKRMIRTEKQLLKQIWKRFPVRP